MTNRPQQFKSKAAFIRAQGLAAPDTIVAAGKAEGLKISKQDISAVRHQVRVRAAKLGKPGESKPELDAKVQFTKIAMRLGTDESQRLLDALLTKVKLS